jgi:hypothetical protein
MTPASPAPVEVLYIGGWGRSGSTLLGLILGRAEGMFFGGEIRQIWQRGVRDNELCGCGEPFLSCPFWTDVGADAFGGWSLLDVDRALELQRRVDRLWTIPMLALRRPVGAFGRHLSDYHNLLARLYGAIRRVSGCEVVVDSSKDPPHAFVLRTAPGIHISVIHLVRDSRAVAFSWQQRVLRPEVTGAEAYMDRYDATHAALRWFLFNALFHGLEALGVRRRLLRYEALASDPGRALAGALDGDAAKAPSVEPGVLFVGPQHTVSGNPVRFVHDTLEIELDERWKTELDSTDRRLVEAFTWPLLWRYGYLAPRAAERGRC